MIKKLYECGCFNYEKFIISKAKVNYHLPQAGAGVGRMKGMGKMF